VTFAELAGARAGETLAASLDYATTLQAVAALAVDGFADACRQLSVELAPVAARELIAEAMELLGALAAERGITPRADPAEGLPAVLADRNRILQVFSNLGGNAVKFTPTGGQITLGAAADGECVTFFVADTGQGIPAEHIAHLFDRLWQASRNDRRGIGLGLAIVRGIVAQHRDRVGAESTPGEGSTFRLTLPAVPPRQE